MITGISSLILNFIFLQRGRDFHESPESLPQKCEKSFLFLNDHRACFTKFSGSQLEEETIEKGGVHSPFEDVRGPSEEPQKFIGTSGKLSRALFSRLLL